MWCHGTTSSGMSSETESCRWDIEHGQQTSLSLIGIWATSCSIDLTVTFTLNSSTLMEAGVTSGSAALAAELHKHNSNNAKGSELGWKCIAMHSSGDLWQVLGCRSQSHLASRLAIRGNCSKSHATCQL